MSISLQAFDIDFKSSRDHSKWAVAIEGKVNQTWTCIGDINRAVSMDLLYTKKPYILEGNLTPIT